MTGVLTSVAQVILGVSPAIFVFSVTLLGTAIEQSQREEKAARENAKAQLQDKIDKVEIALKKAREDGNTTDLTAEVEELTQKKAIEEEEIEKIKKKYRRIDLLNTVVLPSIAALLVLIIAFVSSKVFFRYSLEIFIGIEALLVGFALFKLYLSLEIVQSISSGKREDEQLARIKEVIKLALSEHEQDNKEEARVIFDDVAFPLNAGPSQELEFNFKVGLAKGATLYHAEIWFYIPDEFNLIQPSEEESWRQPANYSLPNIRTVRVSLGTVSIGPFVPRSLKIKTPVAAGKYSLRYVVKGEGYFGTAKDVSILVG